MSMLPFSAAVASWRTGKPRKGEGPAQDIGCKYGNRQWAVARQVMYIYIYNFICMRAPFHGWVRVRPGWAPAGPWRTAAWPRAGPGWALAGWASDPGHGRALGGPRKDESPPGKNIGCKCGYSCGTIKALDKHLARFLCDPSHAAQTSKCRQTPP